MNIKSELLFFVRLSAVTGYGGQPAPSPSTPAYQTYSSTPAAGPQYGAYGAKVLLHMNLFSAFVLNKFFIDVCQLSDNYFI